MRWYRKSPSGFTFVELLVVTGVMMTLALALLPLSRVSMQRQRETELRRVLREVRTAIDTFRDWAASGAIAQADIPFGSEFYPPSLETLVDGVLLANDATGVRKKFLRRIPVDPMTGTTKWGLRSFQDGPDSKMWGGQNVFDIYTRHEGKGLDGTKYRDW
jgi:general secretion pathway protein G